MNKGAVIFAHNSREIDYAKMAIVSGSLANKHLKVPVSLISDESTLKWLRESDNYSLAEKVFEKIITVPKPTSGNYRNIFDGALINKTVPFENANRSNIWNLTPYDRTLLLDSDFLVYTDCLNNYWDYEADILISSGMSDVRGDRIGSLDRWVSDEGVKMLWATTVMFTKNNKSKLFFDLVDYIRLNWNLFSDIYRFVPRIYRNDISFSIAKHILNGFDIEVSDCLPEILTCLDKDLIHEVHSTGIRFLLNDAANPNNAFLVNIENRDVHMMNKQAITREFKKFMESI